MKSVPRPVLSLLCVLGAVLLANAGGGFLSARLLPPSVPDPSARSLGSFLLLILLALGLWTCWELSRPLELLRTPEEVGYIPERGRGKAYTANLVRKRRKKGDLPPVYPNGWYLLLDSHLLEPGTVQNLTACGEQVAVYRTMDGNVYVLDAYCPHLGANLAVGGRVVGDCLECPFHGWQFHGKDGKCVSIPYAEKVPEFAKITKWPSCEINGMVFMWYHCDHIEPTWTIPEQEEITSKKWVYRGRTEHYVNAHIEEIPENAADVAHLAFLHEPNILSGGDLRYTKSRLWEFARHSWKVQWEAEPAPNNHCSKMTLSHGLLVFGIHFSVLDLNVVARQVGPGVVMLTFKHSFLGQGMILHCVTPVEPLLQKVSHSIYYQKNVPAFIPRFIMMAECTQFERDVMVWNNKKYLSKPLLVKEDAAIAKHRRWYSQFYSENSPRLTFQEDGLNW
ncbi:PREDICTED: cholesterol 7-desaturase-like [Nanorana parkeri]|uniref:cholesterol 7-desaturase-like n=1 Tax=Nanorana parkeri TaxID=125878 RepID=UPI0008547B4F|nr:PREDICTED: cholesterol 7-desaturase-like [Nanorana parkeri]